MALVALALVGWRVYREGLETHWLALKLRHGGVEARRSALQRIWDRELRGMYEGIFSSFSAVSGPSSDAAQAQREELRARLLLPYVVRVTEDPDVRCRAGAVHILELLTVLHGTDTEKDLALNRVLAATRDHEPQVRLAAVVSLSSLAGQDTEAALTALQAALTDPDADVRERAALELGTVGVLFPVAQPDVASILIPLLGGGAPAQLRIQAAWGLCLFGRDDRLEASEVGRKISSALATALNDPDVELRKAVVRILARPEFTARGETNSAWAKREATILPALRHALSDEDASVRSNAALGLFYLGHRDEHIIQLMEQAAAEPQNPDQSDFVSALDEWRTRRTSCPTESGAPSPP